jgi:hypothetical protein
MALRISLAGDRRTMKISLKLSAGSAARRLFDVHRGLRCPSSLAYLVRPHSIRLIRALRPRREILAVPLTAPFGRGLSSDDAASTILRDEGAKPQVKQLVEAGQ